MSINTSRVLIAGSAAGLTRVAGQGLLDAMMFMVAYQTRSVQPDTAATLPTPSPGLITMFMVIHFLFGIATVRIYAAMIPRFGAGVGTTIRAGFSAWVLASLMWSVTPMVGFVSWSLFTVRVLTSLPVALAAALVGASMYRDDATAASNASPRAAAV